MLSRLRHIHPALILAALDLFGLAVASYLSIVELGGGVPVCGPLKGCETVATSPYSRIAGIPVAVFGVGLSLILLSAALGWWKTGNRRLLATHYGFSLVGVTFEAYFTYLQIFVIDAICVWCASYGISLVLRFLLALAVWLRRDRYDRPSTVALVEPTEPPSMLATIDLTPARRSIYQLDDSVLAQRAVKRARRAGRTHRWSSGG